jgi:RsiW-degrading membrane proteinase PrsW (M82 family)
VDQRSLKLAKAAERQQLVAIFIFIFSFFVAGMVEESVKYFIWRSTKTPDVLRVQELADHTLVTSTATANDSNMCQARAIKVTMAAVDTGFAWSENLLYVGSQETIWNQFLSFVDTVYLSGAPNLCSNTVDWCGASKY